MKKIILLLTLVVCSTITFGQVELDSTGNKEQQKEITEVNINLPDTVQIKDISAKNEDSPSKMPWVIALVIGVLSAIINIWIADKMKNSNEKTISLQLTNAKELALAEFKATLGAKNRQDWIDELRHNLSEFISQSAMINIEFSVDRPDNEKIKPYFQKMNYNKAKIAMLINEEKAEQKRVIDAVNELVNKSFDSQNDFDAAEFKGIEDELVDASRDLFNIHWEKIKNSFSE